MITRRTLWAAIAASFFGFWSLTHAHGETLPSGREVDRPSAANYTHSAEKITDRAEDQVKKEKSQLKDQIDDQMDRMEGQLRQFRRGAREQIDRAQRSDWNSVSTRLRETLDRLNQAVSRASILNP